MSAVNLWKPHKLQWRTHFADLNGKWRFVRILENRALLACPSRISEFWSTSINIFSAPFSNLLHSARMQHRGMVLAAELPADLGKRGGGELLDDIHRHLARKGDRAGVAADLKVLFPQIEVLADAFLDQVDGDPLFLGGNDVAQYLLGGRQ